MQDRGETRIETVEERPAVPWDSLAFGYGAMLPFPVCALGVLLGDARTEALGLAVTILWGSAILMFLAGVRRGLSFRTPGGPRLAQLAAMLWLFLAGLVALLLMPVPALWLLLAGYLSLMALDPLAARRDEAPLHFARLRPPQIAIPVVSIGVVLGAVL